MAITTPEQKLAVAEIAIFTLYFILGAFCAKKHGKPGRIGWLLFLAFCVLRVTANGLSIHPKGSTGAIINSVGISALILTTLGVTHECSRYSPTYNGKVEACVMIFLHIAISTGIILAAIGGSNMSKPDTDLKKDQGLQEGGYLILLTGLILTTLYVLATFKKLSAASRTHPGAGSAKTLTLAVLASLPFLYARVTYGIVYAFKLPDTSLSPYSGPFVVKLVPISLVQIAAATIILVGGLATRNIAVVRRYDAERKISSNSY